MINFEIKKHSGGGGYLKKKGYVFFKDFFLIFGITNEKWQIKEQKKK